MDYINRSLERKFLRMSGFFKVVLVTGARQVGKTTMLRYLAGKQNRTYVSLDSMLARDLAKSDPVLFFQTYKPPIIIDEVQYAPELFSQIKIICDESDETGLFWLTGSQQYNMMKNVQESLAGRVGILQLYGFAMNEKDGIVFENELDFSLACLLSRQEQSKKNDITYVFEYIWRGGLPQLFHADDEQRQEYFNSYINTYLMRDAADLGSVNDALRFGRFLRACAALVGQQVNYKTLADASEISQPTSKVWLELLESMGIVYLLQPYSNNLLKRLAKTPKLYFCDTGFAAYLAMWPSWETLMNGAASGHYFENFIVMELRKSYSYSQKDAYMTYYRDSNAKEINILLQVDNEIHPLEIKKTAKPDRRDVGKFTVLDKALLKQGSGGIICLCEEVIPIDSMNCFIPSNLI
ncbi:MAG: ATP-binding protein [Oscillospiraceae bacterium]|nr:ATP-binding protein [Oscillospiraceae bacterium]